MKVILADEMPDAQADERGAFEAWVNKEWPGLVIDRAPLTGFYKGDDGGRLDDMWCAWRARAAAPQAEAAQRVQAGWCIEQLDDRIEVDSPTLGNSENAGLIASDPPTGVQDAERIINRLMSSDPQFDDCTDAADLIRRLIKRQLQPQAAEPKGLTDEQLRALYKLAWVNRPVEGFIEEARALLAKGK